MLVAARQWGELGAHAPDACANIAKNPRRPVARFIKREELQRLGAVPRPSPGRTPLAHGPGGRDQTLSAMEVGKVNHIRSVVLI